MQRRLEGFACGQEFEKPERMELVGFVRGVPRLGRQWRVRPAWELREGSNGV
jgi:hypothetical protein